MWARGLVGLGVAVVLAACGGDEFGQSSASGGAAGSSVGGTAGQAGSGGGGGTGGTTAGGGGSAGASGGSGGTAGQGGSAGGAPVSCAPTGGYWTVADAQTGATHPLLSGNLLYWAAGTDVRRNQKTGTPPGVVSFPGAGTEVRGFAVGGDHIYLADAGGDRVRVVTISTKAVQDVATNQPAANAIALDNNYVYWTSSSGIRRRTTQLTTGVENLFAQLDPYAIALNNGALYWVTLAGNVYSGSVTGGAATLLHQHHPASGSWGSVDLTIDAAAGDLYWSYAAGATGDYDGGVFRVPLDGSAVETIASNGPRAESVRVFGPCVYWISTEAGSAAIRARQKAGGTAEDVASTGGRLRGLAIDDTAIFWVDSQGGNVMKRFW
jgi:hypothetical protein